MQKSATIFSVVLLLNCTNTSQNPTTQDSQPDSKPDAIQLSVHWDLLSNQLENEDGFRSALTLTNTGQSPLPPKGWTLYFNFMRTIKQGSYGKDVQFTRINGDFYKMEPGELFKGLNAGEQFRIQYHSTDWAIRKTDRPTGFYLVMDGKKPLALGPSTVNDFLKEEQTSRGRNDHVEVPTARSTFRKNARLTVQENAKGLVPTPQTLDLGSGQFQLPNEPVVYYQKGLESEAALLVKDLEQWHIKARMKEGKGQNNIQLTLGSQGKETYELRVNSKTGITIQGSDHGGLFYGTRSLLGLLPPKNMASPHALQIDAVSIKDAPRFPYRGLHLDVARNFQKMDTVKKVLDLMSFYKLNRFQFHLTDDEGWRLEIPGLPELTEVGSRRGHDLKEETAIYPSWGSGPDPNALPGSGFYSRAQFIEILRYATERHIEVIPEIDMPGHARAAIKSMAVRYKRYMAEGKQEEAEAYLLQDPKDASEYRSVQMWNDNVISVCRESTYQFLAKVCDEIIAMYKEAGAPLTTIHTGGDEVPEGVWEKSPDCMALMNKDDNINNPTDLSSWFLARFSELLNERGLITAGWEEIGMYVNQEGKHLIRPLNAKTPFRTYVWNNVAGWGKEDLAYRLANEGYDVVLSNVTHLYFDLAYNNHPDEPGLYWGGFFESPRTYALNPLNMYQDAEHDLMGNPLEPTFFDNKTRLSKKGKDHILGIQGQLWSELIINPERVDYMLFPRILSLAERAWAQEPTWAGEQDAPKRKTKLVSQWSHFANLVGQREMPRLDYLSGGVSYRIPPPGAVIEYGELKANTAFPGLSIRYSLDGSEPTADSPLFTTPIKLEQGTKPRLKAFNTIGRGSQTVVPIENESDISEGDPNSQKK